MADAKKQAASTTTIEKEQVGLLDQIVESGRFGQEASAKERGKNLVKEFVAQVLDGSMTVAKDAEMMINARIAQIDHLLSHSAERDHAPCVVPEAGRLLARAEAPDGSQRNRNAG